MNLLDILLLIPLLLGFVNGYQKGIFRQLAGLIGLVLAIFLSIKMAGWVGDFLLEKGYITENWTNIIGFVITFFVVLFTVIFLGKVLRKTSEAAGLGVFEKLLGAFFGLLKGFLVALVLLFFFEKLNAYFGWMQEGDFSKSMVYEYYQIGLEKLKELWHSQKS